jgi:hypothetical protein
MRKRKRAHDDDKVCIERKLLAGHLPLCDAN